MSDESQARPRGSVLSQGEEETDSRDPYYHPWSRVRVLGLFLVRGLGSVVGIPAYFSWSARFSDQGGLFFPQNRYSVL